jgi:hypothetical protein
MTSRRRRVRQEKALRAAQSHYAGAGNLEVILAAFRRNGGSFACTSCGRPPEKLHRLGCLEAMRYNGP